MENNKRPAQVDKAIRYMQTHGSISSREAFIELGIMSFPKRVCEMRRRGYYVTYVWEEGYNDDGSKWRAKRYYLVGEVTA